MKKLEECPRCGSNGFLVARDMLSTRHCCKCMSTWVPEKDNPIKLKSQLRDAVALIKVYRTGLIDVAEYGCTGESDDESSCGACLPCFANEIAVAPIPESIKELL